jgi:hypothetical protein
MNANPVIAYGLLNRMRRVVIEPKAGGYLDHVGWNNTIKLVAQPTLYFSGRAGVDHTVAKARYQPLNIVIHR